mmetsp:Transcript_21143/g.36062  ORF Transcript_21143/g.36062 Transcript_21143/m.36062 type:complete len:365 (-) Transcript_21143:93-1187(-)|eukprot:CAMPEP_0116541304 /NCGR_PEP_ID=MMETSP0397-20121206/411_1 /TAXON_ID=216820 /ORGANISM="Cyclophora tenuis, Strain ECT3854" /LENGTH=364 /DNA_ID=CAMNT_0004065237 /DNA_START=2361 /DNA_END=3455 /DNA_ORIENTATION=-
MKIVYLAALILSSLAAASCEMTEIITIPYHYLIEVNETEITPTRESGIATLERETRAKLDELLGDSAVVQVAHINSTILDECASFSDSCSAVESKISVVLGRDVDSSIVELATLDEIQLFINLFNKAQPHIEVTFTGPFIMETDVIVKIKGVSRVMTEAEITIFEQTLIDVLNPLEEGVLATGATVYLQILRNMERRAMQSLFVPTFSNYVNTRVRGTCRGCSSDRFASLVDEGVEQNMEELEMKLAASGGNEGTDYFENTTVVTLVSEANEPIAVTEPEGLSTFSSPEQATFPYWILMLLGGAVFVVVVGFCYVAVSARKGRHDFLEKERQKYLAASEKRDRERRRRRLLPGDEDDYEENSSA